MLLFQSAQHFRHFSSDSINSLASCPTTAGDSGRRRVWVSYERGCCLPSKRAGRLSGAEETNWSQPVLAGQGRKGGQCPGRAAPPQHRLLPERSYREQALGLACVLTLKASWGYKLISS